MMYDALHVSVPQTNVIISLDGTVVTLNLKRAALLKHKKASSFLWQSSSKTTFSMNPSILNLKCSLKRHCNI